MSIECFEGEPDETGTSMVEDTPPLPKVLHAFFDPQVECVSSSSFMVLPLFMYVVQGYCYVVQLRVGSVSFLLTPLCYTRCERVPPCSSTGKGSVINFIFIYFYNGLLFIATLIF